MDKDKKPETMLGKDGKPCNHKGYFQGVGMTMVMAQNAPVALCNMGVICSNCGWLNVIPVPVQLPQAPGGGVAKPPTDGGGVARA